MTSINRDFLLDLLSTPSPSGNEFAIQRKLRAYMREFADVVDTDLSGNVIGVINPKSEFRVMLAGHCDEIGFMVTRIDDKGFLSVMKVGGISQKIAPGMRVEILGYGGTIGGVVGVMSEHHGGLKDGFGIEDIFIDCGATSKEEISKFVRLGDYVVYKRSTELLLNNRIAGRGLDNRTGAFIVAETLRILAQDRPQVGVYAVSTVNEETNMTGAYFAGAQVQPSLAIACDVTFATDFAGTNPAKHGDIVLDGGPVLARGAPINIKANVLLETVAAEQKIPLQYELTPAHTGTDADKVRLTGRGVPTVLVSLPLRYMHSPVEVVSLADLEAEVQLLVGTIKRLTGTENFNPLDD
jgi:putative aminopeptidase FrvX